MNSVKWSAGGLRVRRVKDLYSTLISFETLYAAYKRALKGNANKKPGLKFFFHAETEILALQRELTDGSYQPGAYHFFKCFEPKERTIAVAPFRDRVVHHAVVGVLEPTYEKIVVNGAAGRGLPIGNQTSQFFANIYLDQLDHFIKEKKRMHCYIRYMDDFAVFSNDKAELLELRREIPEFLADKLKLQLKEKATYINSRANGLSFLGRRIFPSLIRIQPANLKRCLKTIDKRRHEYAVGLIDEKRLMQSQVSCVANLKLWNTYHLRKKIYAGQLA
ncbi:MAG: hypothetical protein LDLANPLL_01810 [Turneriella sp.]|nr:hypothetical protein [Turneriella sp.]